MDRREELFALRRALRDHLLYQRSLGVRELPRVEKPRDGYHESVQPPGVDSQENISDTMKPPQAEEDVGLPPADFTMADIRRELEERGGCCELCRGRTNLVFGEGNEAADLVFVGEAPGREEDLQGLPFVGAAGHKLTQIIEAIDLKREDVYICNVVKCRPPGNRNPRPSEIASCLPYLIKQLRVLQPRVIVALGNISAQALLRTTTPITRLRGEFHYFRGVPLMPTYHPAYILRNPSGRRPVWEDMKKVRDLLMRKG